MKVKESIEINVSPEKIWPFFTEPEKIMLWYSTIRKFEYTSDQRKGVGTPIYIEEQAGGPEMKIHFQATEWDENKNIAINMVSGTGVKSYNQVWSLEKIPSGTRFTFQEEVELPFGILGKLLGLIGQKMSEGTVTKIQNKLKELCEEV